MRLACCALIAVVCLGLVPVEGGAATITTDFGTVGTGSLTLSGEFNADNDIALFHFTLTGSAVVSAEMTSHLESPAGFDPILTLFGPGTDYLGGFDFLESNDFGFLDPRSLAAGTYLLALTQYHNYFSPGDGFDFDADLDGFFTNDFFGPAVGCAAFVAFDGTCREPFFDGILTIEQVPEPGTLSLLTLACAIIAARRRHCRRSSIPTG